RVDLRVGATIVGVVVAHRQGADGACDTGGGGDDDDQVPEGGSGGDGFVARVRVEHGRSEDSYGGHVTMMSSATGGSGSGGSVCRVRGLREGPCRRRTRTCCRRLSRPTSR